MSHNFEQLATEIPGSTPDLMRWVQGNLARGCSPASLQQKLLQAGWPPQVAQTSVSLLSGEAPLPIELPPMPEPNLTNLPSEIDVGDRKVQVLLSMERPRIVLFGNLLSDEECDALIEDARPAMARSKTVATKEFSEQVHPDRTSYGMFFHRGQTPLATRIEERIAKLLHWPVQNGEGLQVLNYKPGAEYKPHYDYFNPDEPSSAPILRRGGQRLGTVVIYLNDVAAGGCTFFPESRLRVHPRKGHAVFFSYPEPKVSSLSLHGGDPVVEGEKWIATKWLREREFI